MFGFCNGKTRANITRSLYYLFLRLCLKLLCPVLMGGLWQLSNIIPVRISSARMGSNLFIFPGFLFNLKVKEYLQFQIFQN